MQGNIDFTGSLSGSIAGGGGGGGSEVTITPTLETGTKIADYTIDDTSGSLYAPDVESGSVVTITPNYNAGFKVADYTIDGNAGVLYAPLTVNQGIAPLEVIGNQIRIDLSDYYDKSDINNNFQKILTSGVGIKIGVGDVISAPDEYMAVETVIGSYMGKPLYRKCYHFTNNTLPSDRVAFDLLENIQTFTRKSGTYSMELYPNDRRWYNTGEAPAQNGGKYVYVLCEGYNLDTTKYEINMSYNGINTSAIIDLYVTLEYTKITD